MNAAFTLAQVSNDAVTLGGFAAAGVAGVVAFVLLVILLRTCIRVCPPNMVMVIQGAKTTMGDKTYGFKVINGGRALVIPYLHRAELLDLGILPINVRVEGVNSANGITVGADATACVCVDVENESLLFMAVERMLGKTRDQIQEQIQQTMIGNFRGAMNRTTPLEAMGMVESVEQIDSTGSLPRDEKHVSGDDAGKGERARFRKELLSDTNDDLSSFGMCVVSVSFQRIWDSSDYIANLATKSLARKRQEVEVQEAKLQAKAESSESDGTRREQIAGSKADEQITNAKQKLGVAEQECNARTERTRLEADARIAQAQSHAQEKVEQARVDLQKYKNVSDVTLKADHERQASEIHAKGDDQAVRTVRQTRNDLLKQKAELLSRSDAAGRVPLFVQQQLGELFKAYEAHARNVKLNDVVIMDEDGGVNSAVNRGPEGLVDFLHHFEDAFGIRIRDLVATTPDTGTHKSQESK